MMNEYAILMELLTRPGAPMGSGVAEMLEALGLHGDIGRGLLFRRLAGLHYQLRPLGLCIRFNPAYDVFYVDLARTVSGSDVRGTLPDRLAATLLIVISLTYRDGDWVSLDEVRQLRKKSLRSVLEDIRDLASRGYVEFDRSTNRVRPGFRASAGIDLDRTLRELEENPV
ncbi:MAG: hypothetical protein QXS20_03650 [Candidatus Thorarchaeota archaeon]